MYRMSHELGDEVGADAGFLTHFAQSCLLGPLAGVDGALGKGDGFGVGGRALNSGRLDVLVVTLGMGLDDGQIPTAAHLTKYHTAGRGFSDHG